MKQVFKIFIALFITGSVVSSCKQDDSFQDSGIHNPKFNGTIWQYLDTRPELFDTLQHALTVAGLDQVLKNENVTFFAPTDQTILKSVWKLNRRLYNTGKDTIHSLEQIDPLVWRKFLTNYIINGSYLSKDFPQLDTLNLSAFPGQGYVSYDGQDMNIGVLYNDVVTQNSEGTEQRIKYAGYRQLYINMPFSSGGSSNTLMPFITCPVATSDIQPTNGVLHVLKFSKHSVGFNSDLFVQEALAKGLIFK